MCGICGYFKLESNAIDISSESLEEMNNQMILRGPDGGNIWVDKEHKCGLGHRRLSIVDLSYTANQPMSNEDNSIILVFNGEIYNHQEIRKYLQKKYTWKTDHSDTEVIIHAYEEWGIECINKFRGMFAFALWDTRQQQLYLVRDRLGIKPLYYTIYKGNLLFASEIKAIKSVVSEKLKVNERAMYDYLSFLCSPTEETMYDNIYKLRPSTYICYQYNKKPFKVKYYELWDHTHPELYHAGEDEIKEALISTLNESVQLRKESDVPVGVFLSGGIDSSLNCALFAKGEGQSVKTFCIGYDSNYKSYTNENQYAKLVSNYYNTEFYEKYLTEDDLLSFIPKMIYLQDEPIADFTCVPSYYVAKLARENGIIVSQVGEGSDELFCGYRRWLAYLQLSALNRRFSSSILKKGIYHILNRSGQGSKAYTELLRRAINEKPIFYSGAEAFYHYDKQHMVSEKLAQKLNGYESFEALKGTYENFIRLAWDKSDLNWMSYADLCHRLPELLLMRVDKMSMGMSLESRVPFLDHKFVEVAMSIDSKLKNKNNVSKAILKKTVRGIIPDEIIDRKKQGFGVPLQDWIMGRLGKEMEEKIIFFVDNTDYFNKKYIQKILKRKNAKQIWYLYNLAMWWKLNIA